MYDELLNPQQFELLNNLHQYTNVLEEVVESGSVLFDQSFGIEAPEEDVRESSLVSEELFSLPHNAHFDFPQDDQPDINAPTAAISPERTLKYVTYQAHQIFTSNRRRRTATIKECTVSFSEEVTIPEVSLNQVIPMAAEPEGSDKETNDIIERNDNEPNDVQTTERVQVRKIS